VAALIKKDMLTTSWNLLSAFRFLVVVFTVIILHANPLLLNEEHIRLSIRIATVFLSIFGILTIALPAITQDTTEKVKEIYTMAGVMRWEYALSKIAPPMIVSIVGLIIAFVGAYIYSGVVLLDSLTVILCLVSTLFAVCLCLALCRTITSKREVRSVHRIVMIVTILFHVGASLLLPW